LAGEIYMLEKFFLRPLYTRKNFFLQFNNF